MPSLAEMLMGYLPKGASPVFGTTTPQEQAFVPPTGLDQAVGGAINSMATLPQRAIQNSQFSLGTGTYDPSTSLEAAAMTMGASPFGSGIEGTSPVFGAGPIKAYHGSPHDFEKFDLSKIGTGEGAQAYGHGLYFAESPGVAQSYRDALAGLNVGGRHLPTGDADYLFMDAARKAAPIDQKTADFISSNITESLKGGHDLGQMRDALLAQRGNDPVFAKALDAALTEASTATHQPGKMYEVNINADPEHFLDWDKPIGQQPQAVKDAFAKQIAQFGPDARTEAQLKIAGSRHPQGLQGVTKDLSELGIPGIKYLDQGSRSAGQGSYNYVVFNHDLIDILRKYGLAGAAATGAMSSPAFGPQQPNLTAQALLEGS